jgi:N-acetylmuramic acid 6-phosphate etherase
VTAADVAIGLAASGRTPYVLGALRAAREAGAFTAAVSSSPDGPIGAVADVHVFVDTGPEAIAGSTRLKAGTAQKLVLNSFSTALMVRLGKTYSNLMVDVAPNNAKLRGRIRSILEAATGASEADCAEALRAAGDTKTALVSLATGVDAAGAAAALGRANGRVRAAIEALGHPGVGTDRKADQGGGRM